MDPYSISECKSCPHNAFCPGGSKLIISLGYWRVSNITYDIIDCHYFSEYCL